MKLERSLRISSSEVSMLISCSYSGYVFKSLFIENRPKILGNDGVSSWQLILKMIQEKNSM